MILDLLVILGELDHRGAVEDDCVVILHRGILGVRDLDTAPGEGVDLALDELLVISLRALVEEGADDLRRLIVHHLDVEH